MQGRSPNSFQWIQNIHLGESYSLFLHSSFYIFGVGAEQQQQLVPNIIIILADDLGWNDVGFHDKTNSLPTPNIDALAYNGIILNQFYAPSLCSPSRSSLLTGKFPIFTGMQHSVILEAEPSGLPLNLKILPQYLKSKGYQSHLVGKWHQGFFTKDYTPTRRDFDSFFGYYQGHQDYFTHIAKETVGDEADKFLGYDLHDNFFKYEDNENIYGTDLYSAKAVNVIDRHDKSKPLFLLLSQIAVHAGEEPDHRLQAPQDEIDKFKYIFDVDKRIFAAMISKLDQCVGDVVEALDRKGMLENSIIMFMSDNGAPTIGVYATTGSNYPLRGIKGTEFEGGTRISAVIWSPLLNHKQSVSNILMHMVDVLPTLCSAVGIDPKDIENIDGISMWETLQQGSTFSPRTEFPYNIDPADSEKSSGAVRFYNWKYYQGNTQTIGPMYSNTGTETFHLIAPIDERSYRRNIENSQVNRAINNAYFRIGQNLSNKITFSITGLIPSKLTHEKMQQLQKKALVICNGELHNLPPCDSAGSCLFDLNNDPCERYNVAQLYPEKYKMMKEKFESYRKRVVPPLTKPRDKCADPAKWKGEWVNWYDFENMVEYVSVEGAVCRLSDIVAPITSKIRDAFTVAFSNIFGRIWSR